MVLWIMTFLTTCFLAYSNGANDNFKGVATLFGSGTTDYKRAIWWATLTTFAGSVSSIVLAGSLVGRFSGKGLVPDALTSSPDFLITPLNHGQGFTANLVTGALVIFASRLGMPVSTTHISVGSLFGIGLVTGEVNTRVVYSILLSWVLTLPVATVLSGGIYWIMKGWQI